MATTASKHLDTGALANLRNLDRAVRDCDADFRESVGNGARDWPEFWVAFNETLEARRELRSVLLAMQNAGVPLEEVLIALKR